VVVAVTLVAVVALAVFHLKNRRAEPDASNPIGESKPEPDKAVEPPARQPVYFKRYDPDGD
jgi:hypothetical protein